LFGILAYSSIIFLPILIVPPVILSLLLSFLSLYLLDLFLGLIFHPVLSPEAVVGHYRVTSVPVGRVVPHVSPDSGHSVAVVVPVVAVLVVFLLILLLILFTATLLLFILDHLLYHCQVIAGLIILGI
jgi:hypothetical protein